jgi:thiol-disulfide isomerase/thioredoxin
MTWYLKNKVYQLFIKRIKIMRNFYVLIGFLSFVLVSCGQKNSIEGNIKNLGNDTLIVKQMPVDVYLTPGVGDELSHIDTVFVRNGKFAHNLRFDKPTFIRIIVKSGIYKRYSGREYFPESAMMELFWKPGEKLNITGEMNHYELVYLIKGNEFSYDNSICRQKFLKNLKNQTDIEIILDSLMFYPEKEKPPHDFVVKRDSVVNGLFESRKAEIEKVRKVKTDYIVNHPQKELSAFYLAKCPLDTIAKYYDKLDDTVKNGIFKLVLELCLKKYNDKELVQKNKEQIQPGKTAPDFALKSLDGELLSLYSIDREYLVLDFWGSWCGWCIRGFPKMKEYYNKYKKRLEILGIACRDKDEDWRKSIEENQLKWLHVFNGKDDDIPVKYAVEGYPTKIILDRNKKIVAVFLGESDEFYQKLDELLRK